MRALLCLVSFYLVLWYGRPHDSYFPAILASTWLSTASADLVGIFDIYGLFAIDGMLSSRFEPDPSVVSPRSLYNIHLQEVPGLFSKEQSILNVHGISEVLVLINLESW
jgi:hypothetical protein